MIVSTARWFEAKASGARRGAGAAALALAAGALLAACAALTQETIAVGGAAADADPATVSRVRLGATPPLVLRGVDGKPLASVHIPNAVIAYTYVLPPGTRELWVSTVAYANPVLPQHIGCYRLRATLEAGGDYQLRFDSARAAAVLGPAGSAQVLASGELVDRPLVVERACRWD